MCQHFLFGTSLLEGKVCVTWRVCVHLETNFFFFFFFFIQREVVYTTEKLDCKVTGEKDLIKDCI